MDNNDKTYKASARVTRLCLMIQQRNEDKGIAAHALKSAARRLPEFIAHEQIKEELRDLSAQLVEAIKDNRQDLLPLIGA